MEINGQTNVTSQLFGRGTSNELAASLGNFVVTTMPVPWQFVQERIGGTPLAVEMVDSMEISIVEEAIDRLPDCDTVLAVGGGRAIDFGKYMSWKRGCRLVSMPTVLSVRS